MALITDPQVIRFSNERVRAIADKMAALYAAVVAFQADYAGQSISAKITAAGASNTIDDGATQDGRPIITGVTVQNFKAAIDQIKTSFDTTVGGVGATVAAIQNTIQVNGSPR